MQPTAPPEPSRKPVLIVLDFFLYPPSVVGYSLQTQLAKLLYPVQHVSIIDPIAISTFTECSQNLQFRIVESVKQLHKMF